jgi:TolB-like protein/Tfp pilus assembly protein PilF
MSKPPRHFYEFGPFRLAMADRLLLRDGEAVPLTPKLFDILVVLVENNGNLVEKNDLIEEVWPNSFVGENNLTVNISALRKALGDSHNEHHYIETVPRRGYRFVATVKQVSSEGAKPAPKSRAGSHTANEEDELSDHGKDISSLAILPLVNASGNPSAEYLSDGLTESIINNLSQLPQLRVMACSTVFHYKGLEVDPRHVGRELGVQAVLVGKVLQVGARLIIRTELVDVKNGWQLWGEQYNRNFSDILMVEEEISREISEKLRIKLTGEKKKRLTKRYTENTQAYQLYLKGRYYWNKYTKDGMKLGFECFQQAIDLDPNYALAYTGLADSYYRFSNLHMPSREAMPKAKAAAMKALEIDEELAEAHISLGLVRMHYDWDWLDAEREYRRAIDLKPGYAITHQRYGIYLNQMGRLDEAMAELKLAQELDPLSLQISVNLGSTLFLMRQYNLAIELGRKTLETDPNFFPAHVLLGMAYEQERKFSEAIAEFQRANEIEDSQTILGYLGYAYAISGKRAEAVKLLGELKGRSKRSYLSPYSIALIYTGLGEKDQALVWLEKAYEERDSLMAYLKVSPRLDSLRSDPRFRRLLRRFESPVPGELSG